MGNSSSSETAPTQTSTTTSSDHGGSEQVRPHLADLNVPLSAVPFRLSWLSDEEQPIVPEKTQGQEHDFRRYWNLLVFRNSKCQVPLEAYERLLTNFRKLTRGNPAHAINAADAEGLPATVSETKSEMEIAYRLLNRCLDSHLPTFVERSNELQEKVLEYKAEVEAKEGKAAADKIGTSI